jgi:superfamily II DNA or RNA helicase
MFIDEQTLKSGTWQALERAVHRLLVHEGFEGVRLVGQTRDHGADLLAHRAGKRWLFQVKHWKMRVGVEVLDRTIEALRAYRAQVPVIAALNGFDDAARSHQQVLISRRIPFQLWDCPTLVRKVTMLPKQCPGRLTPRPYQEEAIQTLVHSFSLSRQAQNRALVVMATGLGKTLVASEALRRMSQMRPLRTLVVAHTNELVYQLERSFWRTLSSQETTVVWNGYEKPDRETLEMAHVTFACLNTVAEYIQRGGDLPEFDVVMVDECHHVGAQMYETIMRYTRAGQPGGPFLIGLTATPWRPDEVDLRSYFGEPLVCIDLVAGLRNGFLSNVDYRMYTDNINWSALGQLQRGRLSPRQINRTLFITEWDDAVVLKLRDAWQEHPRPRALVFCGTIDHAITMRDRINAMGFCNAAAIYSQTAMGHSMETYQRNRVLCDFHDGSTDVLCAVDILNEGVDVPDVNIVVFQRVTHSRRIFVQQLGRGLRLAPGKDKVIVLDFVSDIRRFAAGLGLKDHLEGAHGPGPGKSIRLSLKHKVTFMRAGSEDPQAESFLRQWLEDVAEVENAGDDASILKYPPPLRGARV